MPENPFDVLEKSMNKRVIVSLVGRREYRGTLLGFDKPHMNLVLRDVEEVSDQVERKLKSALIRGAAIEYISP
jgi:small nuclear ribonucleoprotein (snRNP)-like protein